MTQILYIISNNNLSLHTYNLHINQQIYCIDLEFTNWKLQCYAVFNTNNNVKLIITLFKIYYIILRYIFQTMDCTLYDTNTQIIYKV